MESSPVMASAEAASAAAKRKRSPSASSIPSAAPPAKTAKTGASSLSINYLARQSNDDLPLIDRNDALPNLLHLLSSYSSILDRHESLASNLGARPLGPILIKRFERCFESPPRVVATHHKGAASPPDDTTQQLTWLEVVEFARAHPGQFSLSTFSEGKRVCQFYYPQKQLRVQVSEEDFLFINSGRCQELIPPLPIWEDEEKEVCTCDVLEGKLKELTNAADMIAARTRQLSHRLKGRRAAILERRADGGSGTPAKASAQQTTTAPPSGAAAGFTAVNVSGREEPAIGSNVEVRNELLRHFEGLPQNQGPGRSQARHHSVGGPSESSAASRPPDYMNNAALIESPTSSLSPVPQSHYTDPLSYLNNEVPTPRPASTISATHGHTSSTSNNLSQTPLKHNFSRPLPPALESSQPFRPLCQAHMDGLPRGQRVLPPCDRCRRLRMDCVKNLTSCAGCTKKHARCHWRDVSREELGALDHLMGAAYGSGDASMRANGHHINGGGSDAGLSDAHDESEDDDSNPLEDLEALGEKVEAAERLREDEEGILHARHSWEDAGPDARDESEPEKRELPPPVLQKNDDLDLLAPRIRDEPILREPLSTALRGEERTESASAFPRPPAERTPLPEPMVHAGFRPVNQSTAFSLLVHGNG